MRNRARANPAVCRRKVDRPEKACRPDRNHTDRVRANLDRRRAAESDCLRAAENDRPDDPTKIRVPANPDDLLGKVDLPGKDDRPDRNQTDHARANPDRHRADCPRAAESDCLRAAESDCLRAAESDRPDDPTKIRVPANPACLPGKVDRPDRNQTDPVRANPDRHRADCPRAAESDCLRAAENDRPDDPTKIRVRANPDGLPEKVDRPDRNQTDLVRANPDRRRADCLRAAESDCLHAAESVRLRAAENDRPDDPTKIRVPANPAGLPEKVDRPDQNQTDLARANLDRYRADCLLAAESDCPRAAENDRPDDPTKIRVPANPAGLPEKVDLPDRNQIDRVPANLDRRRAAENFFPNDAAKNCLRANPVGLPEKADRLDRNQTDLVRANPDRRRAAESDCLRAAENDRPDDPTKSRVRDRRRAPRSGRAGANRNRRAS